jgi:hypothetical protein
MHLSLAAYCALPVLAAESLQVQSREGLKYLGKERQLVTARFHTLMTLT